MGVELRSWKQHRKRKRPPRGAGAFIHLWQMFPIRCCLIAKISAPLEEGINKDHKVVVVKETIRAAGTAFAA